MIKYILFGSKLFLFLNSKSFFISFLPPETLSIEKSIFFKDVKTDNLYIYFLTNDFNILTLKPETGDIKSFFRFDFLRYSYKFDISDKGIFYFLFKRRGAYKIISLKFSPVDTVSYLFDFNEKIIDFFVLSDSLFIFITSKNTYIYRFKKRLYEIKGKSKSYGKFLDFFFDYKEDTLYFIRDKIERIFLPGYDFVFKNDRGFFVIRGDSVNFIEK